MGQCSSISDKVYANSRTLDIGKHHGADFAADCLNWFLGAEGWGVGGIGDGMGEKVKKGLEKGVKNGRGKGVEKIL